jgi:hypothetical protein
MSPARFKDVIYEEAEQALELRFQRMSQDFTSSSPNSGCPSDKSSPATKKADSAGKAVKPEAKQSAPTPKSAEAKQEEHKKESAAAQPADPRTGKKTAASPYGSGGDKTPGKKCTTKVPTAKKPTSSFSEFDSCPEGQFFCTKDKVCKPIPHKQGIQEDGMRVKPEFKECVKKDGTKYGIPNDSNCKTGRETSSTQKKGQGGKPVKSGGKFSKGGAQPDGSYQPHPTHKPKTDKEKQREGLERKAGGVARKLATLGHKAGGIGMAVVQPTPLGDGTLEGERKREATQKNKPKEKDSVMKLAKDINSGLHQMMTRGTPT